jgi:PTS system nitrogen regulatory IIA component
VNAISDLLQVEDILLDADIADRDSLLGQIAGILAKRRGISEAAVLQSLKSREQLGSTALGHGVAIPHARMTQCSLAGVAFVRTRQGIAFDAPDGKPVSMFLGLIVPNQATESHLKLLATAAAMFSDRVFRNALRTSADPASVRDLLRSWPVAG